MAADKSQCSAWQRVILGSQDTISPESDLQVGLLIGDMCRNITKSSERALQYIKASGLINANRRDFHVLTTVILRLWNHHLIQTLRCTRLLFCFSTSYGESTLL